MSAAKKKGRRTERQRKGRQQKASKGIPDRLLDEGIKPAANEIAFIAERRRFACVVFEPFEEPAAVARNLGWDGSASAFPLTEEGVCRLAKTHRVAQRWFATRPTAEHLKIFVIFHAGTLLVNCVAGEGFSIEPSSLDRDLMQ